MVRVLWFALLSAVALAFPAYAKGVLYDCDIAQTRQAGGWISEKMAIVVTEDGRVVVSDAVILMFNREPLQVRVSRNTDRKLAIRWTLKNIVNGANQTTPAFEYSATLTKSSNRIAVYANPDGYPNRFSGKGTCAPRFG